MRKFKCILLTVMISVTALTSCTFNKDSNTQKGNTYLEEGSYQEALDCFERDISNEKNLKLAYRGEGIAYMKLGNYKSAVMAFEEALEQAGGKVTDTELDICYYMAQAQYENGDYEDAIDTCSNLLIYDEENADALYLRGTLYLTQDNKKDASSDFTKMLKYDDSSSRYIDAYKSMMPYDKEAANEYLSKALDSVNSDSEKTAEEFLNAGIIYYYMKEYDDAADNLEKAKEEKSEAVYYLVLVYSEKKDHESALKYATQYAENEKSEQAYNMLGLCSIEAGDYDAAIAAFEKGIKVGGALSKELMKNQIIAYEKSSDYENAMKKASDYLETYPDDEDIKKEYIFLQHINKKS